MSESTIKLNAIVVRRTKTGENDNVLTLLSPEYGKLTVLAKGVRSLRHHSRAAALLLCYSNFVLKRIRDDFYTLISAQSIESFAPLSEDIILLSYGIYFASLCEMCISAGMEADEEVRLLLNCLYILTKRVEAAPLTKVVFEIKLAGICGILPLFSMKCTCGKAAEFFSAASGETRCLSHRDGGMKVSKEALALACYINDNSLRDALFMGFDKNVVYELNSVTEAFLLHHLGNMPKTLGYLHNMIRLSPTQNDKSHII